MEDRVRYTQGNEDEGAQGQLNELAWWAELTMCRGKSIVTMSSGILNMLKGKDRPSDVDQAMRFRAPRRSEERPPH